MPQFYIFPNGMIMAFDRDGQQMTDYQGPVTPELLSKILADFGAVPLDLADWDPLYA